MSKLYLLLFCLLCVLVLFQDFLGIFLFNMGVPKYLLQIFLSLKDILVILMLVFGLITRASQRRMIGPNATIFFFAGYSLVVAAYFVYFGGLNNIGSNMNDLRSLIFPVYAYLAGYSLCYLDRDKMVRFMEKAAFFSVLLSLGFYFMGEDFLVRLRVLDYTEEIRGYFGLTFRGLPSAYFTKLSTANIFRLAGPVFNSVGTAILYTFVAGISMAYYRSGRKGYKRRILLLLLIASIALTFSRGAIIGFVLGLVMTDLLWAARARLGRPVIIIYCLMGLLLAVFFNNVSDLARETFTLADSSARSHYTGLMASWDYLKDNWMGRGIGSVGMWKGTDYTGGASENSYIYIIGQAGIFAFLFLAGAFISVLRTLITEKGDYLNYGLLICAIAVLFNSVFSPSLLIVTPLILFWFFVGYSEGACRLRKRADGHGAGGYG